RRSAQRQADADNGDSQGHPGEQRLVSDIDAGSVGDHGDEMGAPDGGAAGYGAQEHARRQRYAALFPDPPQKSAGNPATDQADESRQGHQTEMVIFGQTREDAHTRGTPDMRKRSALL